MSQYGIKIKNIHAGMIYDVNLGIRDYFTCKDAMLNNSLFNFFLQKNGMNVYKGETTRDIICLDYDFGSRSYEEERDRLEKLLESANDDSKERIYATLEKIEQRKDLYSPKKRDEIREYFYEHGVNVTYKKYDKEIDSEIAETIHYKMLFRTSAKAKLGQVMFINEKLYDLAYDWLTIGLGKKMSIDNAKIVEMSAYAPLTTSTIIDTIHVPVEDILILKDQDSFFKTLANIVRAETYIGKSGEEERKCVVVQEETEVKNTLWDGMMLIESTILPKWVNGMILLRNHLFKACGFRTYIQKFFMVWCDQNGHDYNTYQVQDMFGKWHYLKDIKMITTDNAIKWKKFADLMGNTLEEAYEYWCNRIRKDGCLWGVVKTDHPSKLGEYQQLSYQMINTLPCTKNDVRAIAQTTIDYIELLKNDNAEFEKFLRKNANEINHYEMLADLYSHNHEFANSTFFREEKRKIIYDYVYRMRKGKILVNGDNLTICGNPYALLLYSVGEDFLSDPTFSSEDGCIQCYTKRFDDGEYLAGFRNPHNSPNNICYLRNVYSPEMEAYFPFSSNIMAVNCIQTDIQSRANGCDFDSDFMLVTNQLQMVECARVCYKEFPTIVNDLKESGITYQNTKKDYAIMDNKFSKSRMGIGYSSNLAQLAMTYYWTEKAKENPDPKRLEELYHNFVILSVVAQIIIDSSKREYEIDGNKEIDRISKMDCMTIKKQCGHTSSGKPKFIKYDFPEFMRYTREIKYTKDGKDLPEEDVETSKSKLKNRINPELVCPMNWLEYWLDNIQKIPTTNAVPVSNFFIKMSGKANYKQITKIMSLVEEYDKYVKHLKCRDDIDSDEYNQLLLEKSRGVFDEISKVKINNLITINRLVETALSLKMKSSSKSGIDKGCRYSRKILNLLFKTNRSKFLSNFIEY